MSVRSRKKAKKSVRGTTSHGVSGAIDPAENYYQRSRDVVAEYEASVRGTSSSEYLGATNYEGFGGDGNPRSKQGFDPTNYGG